jgi:hypothetical protein
MIGPAGGSIAIDGHRLDVPPGAVRRPVLFTLSAPSSRELVLDVSANGRSHFVFARPAVITISYARCSGQTLEPGNLRAWFIEDRTGHLLQEMPSEANETALTISFPVRHLSTYAVAY